MVIPRGVFVSIPKWCDCKKNGLATVTYLRRFQFLNGAIVRRGIFPLTPQIILFQFLNGAIVRIGLRCFAYCLRLFQFLNGAIVSVLVQPK